MRIKNFWYWCNLCQVRFPVPLDEVYALHGAWPTHKPCGKDSVSEDDRRFITLDRQLAKQLKELETA